MTMKEKSFYSIQIVEHALDVLEQFHSNHDELGITELSRLLKLQKNKVCRLLATLESHNFVEQNKTTSGYRLGLKNLQLRQSFVKHNGLLRHSNPVLKSLTDKCNETSYLAVLKDYQAIYINAIESNLPVRVGSRVGRRYPFYCTAVGKVLVAAMNEKILGEYLESKELTRFTPKTIVDPDELTKHLRIIAETGYAVDDEELEIGVTCLAAPIRDYTKRVVGAVSLSAPSTRFTAERKNSVLIPLIREAAEELSARLGCG